MRRPIKWNIVIFGFALFVIGILLIIFVSNWEKEPVEVHPLGIILSIASFFVICYGLRIKGPEG